MTSSWSTDLSVAVSILCSFHAQNSHTGQIVAIFTTNDLAKSPKEKSFMSTSHAPDMADGPHLCQGKQTSGPFY